VSTPGGNCECGFPDRKSLDCGSAPAGKPPLGSCNESFESLKVSLVTPPRSSCRTYLARTSEWVTACTESMMRF
jgi:hypothetical protein